MISEILAAAGAEYAQGRFIRMPEGTHAVYFDDVDAETADPVAIAGMPRVYHHSVTVEVYEPAPDDAIEAAIEAELDARGLSWSKQDRFWLKDLQRYQTVYEFTYTSKSK
ncbi:MAG: hypothetical protein IKY65_04540 [Rikenellaceae bacterium]|nr:hypothetical protein [Rikenellaceae bacterium]